MLQIKESDLSNEVHNFTLSNINRNPDTTTFELTSTSYDGIRIEFYLYSAPHILPNGYTVSVYLFKNTFHLQQEIIDLRVNGLSANKGKIGYFFRLDGLFENGVLQLNQHTYCYAYYALQYLFSHPESLQTKIPNISTAQYKITDFFDEDTIILVLCNEYCNGITGFNIDNYLANLFLFGFVHFNLDNSIETVNSISYIENKYNAIKSIIRPDGVYIVRLNQANEVLCPEAFISHLFKNLIQKKNDPVARFLMLYQVVEIYMSKIFPYEIGNKICSKLLTLDSFKLKDILNDMQKQKTLIQSLFNTYSRPTPQIETEIKHYILDFFTHVGHPDYTDAVKNSALTLTDLFYDMRNKLVHEYRMLHTDGVDSLETILKINYINWLTEALMAEVITEFTI